MAKLFSTVLVFLVLSSLKCASQAWTLIANQDLTAPIRLVSLDRLNNIYLNDTKGNIFKLDSQAKSVAQYAPSEYGLLSSLEAWSSLRVFLFYQDTQRYTFLDRFLAVNEFSEFPEDLFNLISWAAPTADNQLWLLNLSALQLVKFDMKFNSVTLNQPLNQLSDTLDLEPYQLNEYQNRVYLGDVNAGILVFDNLGNYLHTLSKVGSDPFHFKGDQFYYLNNGNLHIQGLYRAEHKAIDLPSNGKDYDHVMLLEQSTVLISGNQLEIYDYTPL